MPRGKFVMAHRDRAKELADGLASHIVENKPLVRLTRPGRPSRAEMRTCNQHSSFQAT
jgi:hypothetical protein